MLSLRCFTGFSLVAFLSGGYACCCAQASHCGGFCRCTAQALENRLGSCGSHMGFVALQHLGSSGIRDRIWVSCLGRWIVYHWATREALINFLIFWCYWVVLVLKYPLWISTHQVYDLQIFLPILYWLILLWYGGIEVWCNSPCFIFKYILKNIIAKTHLKGCFSYIFSYEFNVSGLPFKCLSSLFVKGRR